MKTAALITVALASHAHAEVVYQLSDNMWVWSGGSATKLGNGWFGSGWDRFPGVSPPWNPIGTVEVAPPPVVVVPMPQPVLPPSAPEVDTSPWTVLPPPAPRPPANWDVVINLPAPLVIVQPPQPPTLEVIIGGQVVSIPRIR